MCAPFHLGSHILTNLVIVKEHKNKKKKLPKNVLLKNNLLVMSLFLTD